MKKIFIIFISLSTLISLIYGQGVNWGADFTLSGNNYGTNYIARDFIQMNEGYYSYSPWNPYCFTATIDESMCLDVVPESPINPDTRVLNTSLPVGATAGSSDVSATGAATYQIPIFVSPGTAGVQPNISIVYNSRGGNSSVLGVGWNISGLSAITRVPKNLYNDAEVGGVNLDANDRFSLDGNRLLCTYLTYGQDGSQYRTEIESFVRVTSYGIAGTGPSYFIAETKDGTVLEFGNSPNSKLVCYGGTVLMWHLNKITDANGNYMEYIYGIKAGSPYEIYIKQIKYTGNTAAGITPFNEVNFYYSTRPDVSSYSVAGTSVSQSLLLRKINLKCEEKIVHEYCFTYTTDFNTHLNQVKEFDSEGNQFNSTIINWGNAANQVESVSTFDNDQSNRFYYGDFNGDGKTDFIRIPRKTAYSLTDMWEVYINQDGTNFAKTYEHPMTDGYTNVYFNDNKQVNPETFDYDGDGLDDFILIFQETVNSVPLTHYEVYASLGTTFNYNCIFQYTYGTQDIKLLNGDFNGEGKSSIISFFSYDPMYSYNTMVIDFDGDGRCEILGINSTGCKVYDYRSGNYLYEHQYITADLAYPGDFNGDGKTDLLRWNSSSGWYYYFSNGTGFSGQGTVNLSTSNNPITCTDCFYSVADFNGDGRADILEAKKLSATSCQFDVHYFNGTEFIKESNTVTYTSYGNLNEGRMSTGDFNGDGKSECFYKGGDYDPGIIVRFHANELKHYVYSVTDGLNQKTSFTYLPLTAGGSFYTGGRYYDAYPLRSYKGAMYCVSSATMPDGVGGTSTTTYNYTDAIIHVNGKGFLGFLEVTATNNSKGLKIQNTYDFNPDYFNSFLTQSSTYTTGNVLISSITNTNDVKVLDATTKRIFPYVSQSVSLNNLTHTSVTSSNTYDNDGNLTNNTATYGNVGQTTNIDVITTTVNVFNQYGGWGPKNKITRSTVTKTYTNQPAFTRMTDYSYDTYGKLTQTVTDPGKAKAVTQTFTYSAASCGRPLSGTVSASDITSRTSSFTYDPKYRFALTKTNALNQPVSYQYDYSLGAVTSETDLNGNITLYSYDGFGRLKTTNLPTGKVINSAYGWVTDNTPANARYYITTSSDGSPTFTTYFDILGRELRKVTTGFEGAQIYQDKEYFADGNLKRSSNPYLSGGTVLWTTNTYDSYKRILQVTTPTCSSTMDYNWGTGKSVKITDCNGHWNTKTVNSAGNIVSATDIGGAISYTYHSSGQVKSILAAGATTSMTYDEYGKQTTLVDPNAGTITYTYNSIGELLSQTNAKSQVTGMTFDKLGRVLTKNTPEGTLTYTYDNATKGKGMISSVTGYGNTVTFTYDNYSRLNTKTNTFDGTSYSETYTYDNSKNAVSQVTYPSGFSVTNEYDSYGYLKRVKRGDNAALIWQCTSINQLGQVTSATLGNNLTVTRGYDQYGFPTTIQTGSVQNMEFSFNTATGNLTWRKDKLTGRNFTENFTYDNLDRLTNCNIGAANYGITYNTNGNIATKHDAGTYQYGTKPHAVSQLTNSPISDPAQTITYNSFEQPVTLSQESKNLTITYGVDNQRVKSVYTENSVNWTRKYIDNYEEVLVSGQITKKIHYIGGGDGLAAVYIINSSGVGTIYYASKDYLGNILLLTNQNGTVAEEYSYDAWGRRRSPTNWASYTVTTPTILYRGYTGHEHLDEFALINMNGRCYDPKTGRFLSPDNFVQNATNTQSYNRYSYCHNNPLKYKDPSGESIWGFLRDLFITTPIATIFGPLETTAVSIMEWKWPWKVYKEQKAQWKEFPFDKANEVESWFKKDNGIQNTETGKPGDPTRTIRFTGGSDGEMVRGYYFGTLEEMVNFMWRKTNELNIEISGVELKDAGGNISYWVYDWVQMGNTKDASYSAYKSVNGFAMFDGKYITALIHTHTSTNYEYDGPSWEDYESSVTMKVPVYSIGETTVSVITRNSPICTEAAFDKLYGQLYSTNKLEKRLEINPFYIAETNDWRDNPKLKQ